MGVSMHDVAAAAGVSIKTVSRVVNEPDAVRPATRERVEEAMARLGFRASFAGRSLKLGRYRTIGLVMFKVTGGNLAILDGIATAAAEEGYAITLVKKRADEELTLTEASRRLAALPVDGMVFNLNRMVDDFETFRPLPSLKTVIISVVPQPHCPTITNDNVGASRQLVELLLGRGHETVRFVTGAQGSLSAAERRRGWTEALEDAGARVMEPERGDWSAESGYEAGARLAADPTCTAVYAANDAMGHGVIDALRDAGRRVPEDVSVVGIEDADSGVFSRPELTVVRFQNERVGLETFHEAIAPVREGVPAHTRVPGILIERRSVADARR